MSFSGLGLPGTVKMLDQQTNISCTHYNNASEPESCGNEDWDSYCKRVTIIQDPRVTVSNIHLDRPGLEEPDSDYLHPEQKIRADLRFLESEYADIIEEGFKDSTLRMGLRALVDTDGEGSTLINVITWDVIEA